MPSSTTVPADLGRPTGTPPDALRAELERERTFRAEQIEELAVDAAEAVVLGDEGRRHVTRMLTSAAEAALVEISAALCRLDDGTYGICEHCGEPVPVERLEVLPTSRLCTPCQHRTESARPGRR